MLEILFRDISAAMQYLKVSIVVSVMATILITVNHCYGNKRFCWIYFLKHLIFITYLILLIEVTLLSREPGSRTRTDLMPFSTWGTTLQSHAYVIENIIMFLPMGFLLPILYEKMREFRRLIFILGLMSAIIELLQYITQRGYLQTDDVITNVLGGVIGYWIWRVGSLILTSRDMT